MYPGVPKPLIWLSVLVAPTGDWAAIMQTAMKARAPAPTIALDRRYLIVAETRFVNWLNMVSSRRFFYLVVGHVEHMLQIADGKARHPASGIRVARPAGQILDEPGLAVVKDLVNLAAGGVVDVVLVVGRGHERRDAPILSVRWHSNAVC